jgi:hypothetical protein
MFCVIFWFGQISLWIPSVRAESPPSKTRIQDEKRQLRYRVEEGRISDPKGYFRGRIQPGGQITNEKGYFKGRVDSSGRLTDEHGHFKGRVQDGKIYDENGYFKGRVEAH